MKANLFILFFALSGYTFAQSAEEVVQKQLDAYNARDIDAFVSTYSDSIKLYNFPDRLFLQGTQKLRNNYAAFFEMNPKLNCEIKSRIVQGNKVIDQERVTGLSNGSVIEATAIYIVENGKISKVYFIR